MGLKRARFIIMFSFVIVATILSVEASRPRADKLNFFLLAENHTVNLTNNEFPPVATTYTVPIPAGWKAFNGSGCTENSTHFNCPSVGAGTSVLFILENPTTPDVYNVTRVTISGGAASNVLFLKIDPEEIFNTLVEFGRGRGNYPFLSKNDTGFPFLPNGTTFELNFLHKVFNVKQYYFLPNAVGRNASWKCIYANDSSVRQHLITNITRKETWNVTYLIDELEGSFERMGFFGQQIQRGAYAAGQNLHVNCSSISYLLQDAGGFINVSSDAFNLSIRNREPVVASAITNAVLRNGTQEVEIAYLINNTEIFPIDSVLIEIQAPRNGQFVGARGELWGEGKDKFVMERTEISRGVTESITLIARFNTSAEANITSLVLSQGIKVKFIPPWEANAYNPVETIQNITAPIGNISVDMGTLADVFNLIRTINATTLTLSEINRTVNFINETVSRINTTVTEINATINTFNQVLSTINATVTRLNTTVTEINNTVNTLNSTLTSINNTLNESTTRILDQLNENTSLILTKVRLLREFEEEAVFLVTDSFGLQEQARQQLGDGKTKEALESLNEANEKLKEAAERLSVAQNDLQVKRDEFAGVQGAAVLTLLPANASPWFILMLFVIVACIIIIIITLRKRRKRTA